MARTPTRVDRGPMAHATARKGDTGSSGRRARLADTLAAFKQAKRFKKTSK